MDPLAPHPDDPRLTEPVSGIDQDGNAVKSRVVVERPLTLFLNGQEIVTMMTILDRLNRDVQVSVSVLPRKADGQAGFHLHPA